MVQPGNCSPNQFTCLGVNVSKTSPNKSESDLPDLGGEKSFLDQWALIILAVTFFLMPLIGYGAVKSMKVYANDVNQWLPEGFQEAERYAWFQKHFGVDEMLVASWDGCKMDDDAVIEFDRALENAKEENGVPIFDRVVCGPEMLEQIKDLGVSDKAAFRRIQGLVVGRDGQTTCVMAFPRAHMRNQRKQLVSTVRQLAEEKLGVKAEDLKLGGPTVDGAAIDIESKKSLDQFLGLTVLVVFLLAWFRLKSLGMAIVVLFFSVLCAGISLSILFYTGGRMNLTMVMLPTLTFILGVSACIHMANYYRKAVATGFGNKSADAAINDGGWPVMLSSLTTAVGLMSLGASQVVPIKLFGLYSALGILCGLPVVLLVMPSAMYVLHGTIIGKSGAKSVARREMKSGVSRKTSVLMNWVCRSHWMVVLPALVALVALSIGITRLKASVKLQNRFAERTQILQDYDWLESNLGPLVPMEVVLRFEKDKQPPLWTQLNMVASVESAIEQTTAVNATYSAATFKPPVPKSKGLRGKMQKKLVVNKWENELHGLENASLMKRNADETMWRISLRVAALNDIDYGDFLDSVRVNVDNQLLHLRTPGLSAVMTGGIPLVYQAQHQILYDLAKSFCTAFIIITFILIFVLGNVRAGLVSMIPNVFPPLVVFGTMGWLGVAIEIGSVMTASVALGIAVDDTIHFLTWYRRGTEEGKSRYKAIQYAFDHCAKAMIDTSLICGLGVMPFLFSVFMPTVRFSNLLCILLMTALVGDLILLPAILAGPAGLLFRLKNKITGEKKSGMKHRGPKFAKKNAKMKETDNVND